MRAIIVTGAGRAFCAGADLARGGETFDRTAAAEYQGVPPERPWEKPARAIAPWDVRKPIIAAINGPAVGVGATLPMQWDIRLAAESAKIGFVFVRRGVVPEALSTWIMPRLVGMARAAELLLTGRMVDAREALAFGIVSRVVPDAELLPAARALAAEIARETAPVSVAIAKWLLWDMASETDLARADDLDARAFWWSGAQPDAREGVRAFLEKRPPRWSMRRRSRSSADARAATTRRACGLVEGRGGGVPAPAAGRSCARYASFGAGGGPSRRRRPTWCTVMRRPRALSTSKKAPRRATTVNTPGTWRCTTRSPI